MDIVLKPVGLLKRGSYSRAAEVVGALLANELDFKVAEPVLVDVPNGFDAPAQEPTIIDALKRSAGLNFGSVLLPHGSSTWPIENSRYLPADFRSLAARIFAFDAVTQNYDRQADNPNLLRSGRTIHLYDHEMAFSSMQLVPAQAVPGRLEFDPCYKHVFYNYLDQPMADWEGMLNQLASAHARIEEDCRRNLPEEWFKESDSLDRIFCYLRWAARNKSELLRAIGERFL